MIKKMFKKMFCDHNDLNLVEKGKWRPTFHTTNGLADEDERDLIFVCDNCEKRITHIQTKSYGSLRTFKKII